jgi:ribonuclease P protein component
VLQKNYRLTKKKDFEKVHKFGRFFTQDFLALKIAKNNLNFSRFGFLVSLKISKKATVRNKVKRRLREAVRLKIKEIKPGFDIIIFVRPEIVKKGYWEIDEAIKKVFDKTKLC